jgi:predicted N-acetyltransferase YhbS
MLTIRLEKSSDAGAREALLDAAYGPVRFEKPSERLRSGRAPAAGLSFVAVEDGRVIGTVRLWNVCVGNGCDALLLGPVAVAEDCRSQGLGGAMVRRAIQAARKFGHDAIVLVGDPEYYERFGFSGAKTGALWMPGPFERHRLLGRELTAGALDGARGMIAPAGRLVPTPDLHDLVAQDARANRLRRAGTRAA